MLKKIRRPGTSWDYPAPCRHPGHNVPANLALEPGEYEWTCPACGHVVRFYVPQSEWCRKPVVTS